MTNVPFSREDLQAIAANLGFSLCEVVVAQNAPGFKKLTEWLNRGYAGGMSYLHERKEAYRHPEGVMPGVRTVIMLGLPYDPAASLRKRPANEAATVGKGRIAAYATGQVDYHDLIHAKLKQFVEVIKSRRPEVRSRGVVDTAPILERDFATLAGMGWIGKNTLLLNRHHGSYFFLAAVLIDQEVKPLSQASLSTDHCGTCTACLDACPTQAFPEPRVLDASRCISYLTIEHRGPIAAELREGIGDWLFGCDICQQVCPWNRMAQPTAEPDLKTLEENREIDLLALIDLNEAEFRKRFRRTPMWRAKQRGLIRNALLILGNQKNEAAAAKIARFLKDSDTTLRSTAAWALGRIGGELAEAELSKANGQETEELVKEEIANALRMILKASRSRPQ